MNRKIPGFMAPLLVASIMGGADAKTVKGEICPTKVSGLIQNCDPGKKCVLHLKRGDVLTDIEYFGSRKCDKKTGFTKVDVADVDRKGIVFNVRGIQLAGIKRRFRVSFDGKHKAFGMNARRTKNPKVVRVLLKH